MTRWDETWHRLLEWTNGQGPSERLAAQILLNDGFSDLDPSHPLGGRDGGQDAICRRNGKLWSMGVYFPRGQEDIAAIRKKFDHDLLAAQKAGVEGFVFVTNQELRLGERKSFSDAWLDCVALYHLERITAILDTPAMASVRKQFLGIEFRDAEGAGGTGGSGTIVGDRGVVIGGRGGAGGTRGRGGDGGGGTIKGNDGMIVGGDGGGAGTADGRGGRGARSPMERMGAPTEFWRYGYGGLGANAPEYNRRIALLAAIRREYMKVFPNEVPFIDAGVDPVPINWINKRLEELGEGWTVDMGQGGYLLPPLDTTSG